MKKNKYQKSEKKQTSNSREEKIDSTLLSIHKEVSAWPEWLLKNAQPIVESNFELDSSNQRYFNSAESLFL